MAGKCEKNGTVPFKTVRMVSLCYDDICLVANYVLFMMFSHINILKLHTQICTLESLLLHTQNKDIRQVIKSVHSYLLNLTSSVQLPSLPALSLLFCTSW
jgi:hypothetical protein